MAIVIDRLRAAFLQRDELIAQVDEGRGRVPAAKLEVKQPAIEGERLVDIADFERDVIEPNGARFLGGMHKVSDEEIASDELTPRA